MRIATLLGCAGLVVSVMGTHAHAGVTPSQFTYQGLLQNGGTPVTGTYDFSFTLYSAASGGSVVGESQCADNVSVDNGVFTVVLDFGAVYDFSPRFVQVATRLDTGLACSSGAGFVTLLPRQELTRTPMSTFASQASSADVASNSTRLNGQLSTFYTNAANLTSGTIPAARYGTSVVQTNTNNTITGINNFSNAGNVFVGNGAGLTGLWRTTGNAGTNPASDFVGTTDNVGFTIRANNVPAIRITPFTTDTHTIVMGSLSNSAGAFEGATIGGGGSEFPLDERNQVTGDFGTIAGGLGNTTSRSGFVGGGFQNRSGNWSVASGGSGNWAFGQYSSVGGGINNRIQSPNLNPPPNNATIAGGSTNEVQGTSGAIGGGFQNIIEQASSFGTIVGGANNRVVGSNATVLGGASNTAGGNNSVVLGSNAKSRTPTEAGDADGDQGTFVFADATSGTFTSTGPNQYLVRASGGMGVGTNAPTSQLHVVDNIGPVARIENTSSTSSTVGLLGTISSATPGIFATGVKGEVAATTGNGVGVTGVHGGNGYGVYGTAAGIGGLGVVGIVSGSNATAVYGNASGASAWAGRFDGRLGVTGAFSATSKAFRIDHPQDPMNKELWHSCVESPDMMNIYNGNVVTDDAGYATISLPGYFESLNVDFKYQLTVIESNPDAWTLAKVTSEIANNEFTIRTSAPNTKVSWQVTGVRNDAYAKKFRIVPEQMKSDENKGKLLTPEALQ